jgi:hypothetical protein
MTKIKKSDVWFLVTDGEIYGNQGDQFAQLACQKAILDVPIIMVIIGSRGRTPETTSISVTTPIFEASENSAILFKETETGKIYVIGGKGCFARLRADRATHDLKSWRTTPVFKNEVALFERCMNLNIQVATAKSRKKLPKGINLGSGWEKVNDVPQRVDVHILLNAGVLSNSDVFALFSEEALPILAIAYKTRRMGAQFQQFLKDQIIEVVIPRLEDVSGAAAIITKMNEPNISKDGRKILQEQLRVAHNSNREHYQKIAAEFSSSQPAKDLRRRNDVVKAALRILSSMDADSYTASFSLCRERDRQEDETSTESEIDMANLDFDGPSIRGSCLICCDDDVVMSICLKSPSSTTDDLECGAFKYPLAAGAWTAYREVISSQNVCYQCALLSPNGTTIYQEPVKAIIPVVKYEGKNIKHINKQLRYALAPEEVLRDSEIAQLYMTILDRVLRTKSWAGAGLDHSEPSAEQHEEDIQRRRIYQWMLAQLISNTKIPKDFGTDTPVAFSEALTGAVQGFAKYNIHSNVITYPDAGFSTILSLGRTVNAFSNETIRRMRIAKAVYFAVQKYAADQETSSQSRHEYWNHGYMKLLYASFTTRLVPKDLRGPESLVTDVDQFFSLLRTCVGSHEYLDQEQFTDSHDKRLVMRKLQLVIFWLIFKHSRLPCPVDRIWRRIQRVEQLSIAVLEPSLDVPDAELHSVLLSIFATGNNVQFVDPDAARLHAGVVPFRTPFGASVIRCGIEGCKQPFYTGDPATATENIGAIRNAQAHHFINSYGIMGRFESSSGLPQPIQTGSPPTSVHTNIHHNIVCTWAAMTVTERRAVINDDLERKKFSERVRDRIGQQARGDIYNKTIEEHVKQVLPSFFQVLKEALKLENKSDDDVAVYEHNFQNNRLRWKIEYELKTEGLQDH